MKSLTSAKLLALRQDFNNTVELRDLKVSDDTPGLLITGNFTIANGFAPSSGPFALQNERLHFSKRTASLFR